MGRSAAAPLTRKLTLFDGDRFGEIARLIDVAAAADSDVIGEKLERDDFEQGRKNFRRRR